MAGRRDSFFGALAEEASAFDRTRDDGSRDPELVKLQKENFNLRMKVYYYEEKLSGQHTLDVSDLVKQNVELRASLEVARREIEERQTLLVKARNALESLQAQVDMQTNQNRDSFNLSSRLSLHDNLDDSRLRTRVQQQEQEAQIVQDEMRRVRQQSHDMQRRIDQLEADNATLRDNAELRTRELMAVRDEQRRGQDLNTSVQRSKAEKMLRMEEDIEDIRLKLRMKESEAKLLSERLDEATSQLQDKTRLVSEAMQTMEEVQYKKRQSEDDIHRLRAQLEDHTLTISTLTLELAARDSKLQDVQGALGVAQAQVRGMDQQLAEARLTIDATRRHGEEAAAREATARKQAEGDCEVLRQVLARERAASERALDESARELNAVMTRMTQEAQEAARQAQNELLSAQRARRDDLARADSRSLAREASSEAAHAELMHEMQEMKNAHMAAQADAAQERERLQRLLADKQQEMVALDARLQDELDRTRSELSYARQTDQTNALRADTVLAAAQERALTSERELNGHVVARNELIAMVLEHIDSLFVPQAGASPAKSSARLLQLLNSARVDDLGDVRMYLSERLQRVHRLRTSFQNEAQNMQRLVEEKLAASNKRLDGRNIALTMLEGNLGKLSTQLAYIKEAKGGLEIDLAETESTARRFQIANDELSAQLDAMTDELGDLRMQLAIKNDELVRTTEDLRNERRTQDQLRGELNALGQRAAQTEGMVLTTQQDYDDVERKLSQARQRLETVSTANTVAETRNRDLEAELTRTRNDLQKATLDGQQTLAAATAWQQRAESQAKDIAALDAELATLRGDLRAAEKSVQTLSDEKLQMSEMLDNQMVTMTELSAAIGQARQARRDAEERTRVAEEAARASEDRARANEDRTRTAEERTRVAEERAWSGEQQGRVGDEMARQAEERFRVAEDRSRAAEDRARQSEDRARVAEERARANEERAKSLDTQTVSLRTAAEARQAAAQQAEADASTLRRRVAELEGTVESLQSRARQLENHASDKERAATRALDEKTQAEIRLAAAAQTDAELQSHKRRIRELEAQVDSGKRELHASQSQRADAETRVAILSKADGEAQRLESLTNNLQRTVEEKEHQIRSLTGENRALEEKARHLQSEVETLTLQADSSSRRVRELTAAVARSASPTRGLEFSRLETSADGRLSAENIEYWASAQRGAEERAQRAETRAVASQERESLARVELDNLRSEIHAARAEAEGARMAELSMTRRLAATEDDARNLSARCAALQAEVSRLSEQLRLETDALVRAKSQLKSSKTRRHNIETAIMRQVADTQEFLVRNRRSLAVDPRADLTMRDLETDATIGRVSPTYKPFYL